MQVNENHTAILLLMDCSGSMGDKIDANTTSAQYLDKILYRMLEEQSRKLAGYITIDVAHFGSMSNYISSMNDPLFVQLYGNDRMGGTYLYEAYTNVTGKFEDKLRQLPEYPGNVLVVVTTDGESSNSGADKASMKAKMQIQGGWKIGLASVASITASTRAANTLGATLIHGQSNKKGFDSIVEGINKLISENRGVKSHA